VEIFVKASLPNAANIPSEQDR